MEFVSFENVSTCTTCSLKRLDFVSHKAYAFPNPSSVCIYVFFVEFPITRFRKIQVVYWIFIVCIYLKQQTCWMFFLLLYVKVYFVSVSHHILLKLTNFLYLLTGAQRVALGTILSFEPHLDCKYRFKTNGKIRGTINH